MKDWFYFLVYFIGCQPMWLTSSPVLLHRERARRKGAYLLVCTHSSPFDVPCLIYHTPRVLDFVSIVEVFRHPLARWFFTMLKVMPLDRGRRDPATVLRVVERLKAGRAVAMFPEGSIRTPEMSALNGGPIKPGAARIAKMAETPILPCVLVGSRQYHRFANWLPIKRIRYGLIYGEPFTIKSDAEAAPAVFEQKLRGIFQQLHAELAQAMDQSPRSRT